MLRLNKNGRILRYLLGILSLTFVIAPAIVTAQEEAPRPIQDEFYRAKITDIVEEETIEEYGRMLFWQHLIAKVQSGPDKGEEILLLNEIDERDKHEKMFREGDRIVVGKNMAGTYYISDIYRLDAIILIALFFFFIAIALARFHGVRAMLGLAITFLIIGYGVLPAILDGQNPFLVSVGAAFLIACVSIYVAHGINQRTTIAVCGTLITLGLAVVLGYFFVYGARLFGLGSEEAFFLSFGLEGGIDLRGLLLGGILIGTLGVLDDVTTAQSAAVEEIHKANGSFSFRELCDRGLSVGREHIVSLVNTLVLAYTGASFPLLLLFVLYERPVWVTLNSEIVVEELIRMLVGSISLMFAVPITTALAAYVLTKKRKGKEKEVVSI